MPASSDGGQGLQNQGGNHQNVINVCDQTLPQRRRVVNSNPIQEGENHYGQAMMIRNDIESDAGSLFYNNDHAGIQATPSRQQPSQPENTTVHSLPSRSPVQSVSGCSGVSMNIPSGGHLRPFHSYNRESVVIAVDIDLQRLKRKLTQKLGDQYEKKVAICVRSFSGTTFSEEDISKCSSQLLSYYAGNVVKCMGCRQTGNIGTIFIHRESCDVGRCSQGDESNLSNRTEGNRRQVGELQDTAAGGQTPQSEETAYIAPGNLQTNSESSSLTRSYTTAPVTPPNLTAQNVHHPTDLFQPNRHNQDRNQRPRLPSPVLHSNNGHVQTEFTSWNRQQEGELQDRRSTDGATGGASLSEITSNGDEKALSKLGMTDADIHRAKQKFKNSRGNTKWTLDDLANMHFQGM